MKINIHRSAVFTALAFEVKQHLPPGLAERLCRERTFWRDLPKRLAVLPIIPKARLIATEKGASVDTAVKYSLAHGLDLYYGYFITSSVEKSSIEPHAFCVYDGRVVETNTSISWAGNCYYVGIPVPQADVQARRFENKFEQMDYILKNLK